MERFYLIFKENDIETTIEVINEPVGYDAVDFVLQQEDGRYGRDVSFVGDDISMIFTKHAHFNAFEKLVDFWERQDFESDITFKVIDQEFEIEASIDFLRGEYNGYDSFSCMAVQITKQALLKKRHEMTVDIFGTTDLDEKPSTPAPFQRMLLKAKELLRESKWENITGDKVYELNVSQAAGPVKQIAFFNGSIANTKFEIRNSAPPFIDYGRMNFNNTVEGDINSFDVSQLPRLINSVADLNNLELTVEFGNSNYRIVGQNFRLTVQFVAVIGYDFNNPRLTHKFYDNTIINGGINETRIINFTSVGTIIPKILTGESVWIMGYASLSRNISGQNFVGQLDINYRSVTIKAKSFEQNFDVITKCVSVYDAVKKVVKDSSGLDINFPLAQAGVLKNNYIFSGNMIRNIQKPFLLSFNDIKKWFPELNLDYEIMDSDIVHVGHYKDYYTNNEIDIIDNVAFDSFKYTQNHLYALNKFNYSYDKFQSQKENTEENSNDIVHGSAEYHVQNIQVENTKDVNVSWVRDPFMLQQTIDKALTETQDTATQDDNTIFIVDTTNMIPSDYNIRKTSVLNHYMTHESSANILRLSNNGSFRWDLLGIGLGSLFTIVTPENQGEYYVTELTANYIQLSSVDINNLPDYSGEVFTEFIYRIDPNNVKLKPKVYTGLGISGIKSPQTFANLDYTVKSNIDKYWKDWIATAIKTGKEPKLLKYENNKDYTNDTNPFIHFVEGSDISIGTPILSTKKVETKLIMPFWQYLRICQNLRSVTRGFIRSYDTKGNAIYIYPQDMKALPKTSNLKEVTVIGELKAMPDALNLIRKGGFIKVFVHDLEVLNYSEISNGNLQFFDNQNRKIFKVINYQKVAVNGTFHKSMNDFNDAVSRL